MSLLNSVLKVFVGDKSKQDVKAILPVVNQIKEFESTIAALSNDALRAKTAAFKDQIKIATNDNEERISACLLYTSDAADDL